MAGLATTTLAPCSAMNAMKSPMPAATAFLSENGIELKMFSRTGVSESASKISPSTNTASSANCHE